MKKVGLISLVLILSICLLLSFSFVSASWFSDFWGKITGNVVSNGYTINNQIFNVGERLGNGAGGHCIAPSGVSPIYSTSGHSDNPVGCIKAALDAGVSASDIKFISYATCCSYECSIYNTSDITQTGLDPNCPYCDTVRQCRSVSASSVLEVKCYTNSDCGADVTDTTKSCSGNNACTSTKTTTYTCANPGTSSSSCVPSVISGGGGCSYCPNGCSNGACVDYKKYCYQYNTSSSCAYGIPAIISGNICGSSNRLDNNCMEYVDCRCKWDSNLNKCTDVLDISKQCTGTCTDSDGGKDYYVKGTVIGKTACSPEVNCPVETITDSCYKDGGVSGGENLTENTIYELYCQNNNRYVQWYNCPNGCSNGACVGNNADNKYIIASDFGVLKYNQTYRGLVEPVDDVVISLSTFEDGEAGLYYYNGALVSIAYVIDTNSVLTGNGIRDYGMLKLSSSNIYPYVEYWPDTNIITFGSDAEDESGAVWYSNDKYVIIISDSSNPNYDFLTVPYIDDLAEAYLAKYPSTLSSQSQPTCTDTDGGDNKYVKGKTYGPAGYGDHIDRCLTKTGNGGGVWISECSAGSNCAVDEAYCKYCDSSDPNCGTFVGYMIYTYPDYVSCPTGCQDGACLPPSYTQITSAGVVKEGDTADKIRFTMALGEDIPQHPEKYIGYVWAVDTDKNRETGDKVHDIGDDFNLRVYYDPKIDDQWHATIDVMYGDDISASFTSPPQENPVFAINQNQVEIEVSKSSIKYSNGLYMLSSVAFDSLYPIKDYPAEGHISYPEAGVCSSLIDKKGIMDFSNYGLKLRKNATQTYYDRDLNSNITSYYAEYENEKNGEQYGVVIWVADEGKDVGNSRIIDEIKSELWTGDKIYIDNVENQFYILGADSDYSRERFNLWYNSNVLVYVYVSTKPARTSPLSDSTKVLSFVESLKNNNQWDMMDNNIGRFQSEIISQYLENCNSKVQESCLPAWQTKTEPVICPEHGFQTIVSRDINYCGSEVINRQVSCSPGMCSGCMVPRWLDSQGDNKCVPYGFRFAHQSSNSAKFTEKLIIEQIIEGEDLNMKFSILPDNSIDVYASGDVIFNKNSDRAYTFKFNIDGSEYNGLAGEHLVIYSGYHTITVEVFENGVSIQKDTQNFNLDIHYDSNGNSYFTIKLLDNYNAYCEIDGYVHEQKTMDSNGGWANCQNNYECESNICSSGECIELVDTITKFKGTGIRIFCKLANLFSIESYGSCVSSYLGEDLPTDTTDSSSGGGSGGGSKKAYCGNGICEEDCNSCPKDCGSCSGSGSSSGGSSTTA